MAGIAILKENPDSCYQQKPGLARRDERPVHGYHHSDNVLDLGPS